MIRMRVESGCRVTRSGWLSDRESIGGSSASMMVGRRLRRLGRSRGKEWVPFGRGLHLVDLENHIFPATGVGCAERAGFVERYEDLSVVSPGDLVVVGVGPQLVFAAYELFPSARLVVRRGPGGGARALLDAAGDPCDVAARFDRVTIGSGNGAFVDFASQLRSRGVTVRVLARPECLSDGLRQVADWVVPFASGLETA